MLRRQLLHRPVQTRLVVYAIASCIDQTERLRVAGRMDRHSGTKQKNRFHVTFRATIRPGIHSGHWNHLTFLVTVTARQKSLCRVEGQQDTSSDIILLLYWLSSLHKLFTIIHDTTMFLGYIVLQLFCSYKFWHMTRYFPCFVLLHQYFPK